MDIPSPSSSTEIQLAFANAIGEVVFGIWQTGYSRLARRHLGRCGRWRPTPLYEARSPVVGSWPRVRNGPLGRVVAFSELAEYPVSGGEIHPADDIEADDGRVGVQRVLDQLVDGDAIGTDQFGTEVEDGAGVDPEAHVWSASRNGHETRWCR